MIFSAAEALLVAENDYYVFRLGGVIFVLLQNESWI